MGKLLNKLKKAWKKVKNEVKGAANAIGEAFDKIFGENEDKLDYYKQEEPFKSPNPEIVKESMKEYAEDHTITDVIMPEEREKTQLENDISELGENISQKGQNIIDYVTKPEQQGGIIDTTDKNIEGAVNGGFTMDDYKSIRNEQWAREDQIRREVQAREDTAYQRATEDMRKAGINPNLIGINPAASGGGITNATGIDTSLEEMDLKKYLTELEDYLDRELKADEGQKDRLTDLITSVIMFFAIKR